MDTEGIYMTEMELIKDVLFEPVQKWEPEVILDSFETGEIIEGDGTNPNTYLPKTGDINNQLIY
jgi:hypothetical protein